MRNKSNGFSLIELVIVLTLIVVLTGLAVTRFTGSFQARSAEQASKDMTAYLRYLQFKAIHEGLIHKLEIDHKKGLVSAAQKKESNEYQVITTPITKRFSKREPFEIRLERGRTILFFPDGSISRNKLFMMQNERKAATIEIKNRIGAFKTTVHDAPAS